MTKEEGTSSLEKKPDAKDAMSKLNELIAMRFDDNSENSGNYPDDISLRAVVEEVIASPKKEVDDDYVPVINVNTDAQPSDTYITANNQQEQLSSVISKEPDMEQELKLKLNELAATSFTEVSYESYELKLEEPKLPEESKSVANNSRPPAQFPMTEEVAVNQASVQPSITQKRQNVAKKNDDIAVTVLPEKKENATLLHKGKQTAVSIPDAEKHGLTPDKAVNGNIGPAGKEPVKTENIVDIIDVLDSIEAEMKKKKKKELPKSEPFYKAGSKKKISQQQSATNIKPFSFDAHPQKTPKENENLPTKVAVLYSEDHNTHSPKNTNIEILECPERLTRAMVYLERSGVFGERCDLIKDKYFASENDLLQVHSEEYVKFVRSYSASGGGFLGDSTYMTSSTFEVAGLAAGSAIQAGELVLSGKYSAAMAIVRPPGHHAGVDKYRGFCIFNNAAVLARYLRKKKGISKVMIIDWDAHAGDGTMEIFYNDPTVMVVSLHRDPHDFYPRRGFSSQIGEGAGKGYTANVEMPTGAGDEEYAFAFNEFVIPLLHRFSPDFVICSCGFDAYYKEQHIKLNLTSAGYHMMTKKIMSAMNGNFVLVMEGGYHKFNGHLAHVVINSLLGLPDPIADTLKITEYERNQQKAVMKETEKKVAYIKEMLGIQDT